MAYSFGLYLFLIVLAISLVTFFVIYRSRRNFSVRPFHSAVCLYVLMYAPYAILKVCAIWYLLNSQKLSQQLAAQVFLNASFTVYFVLGLGGKVALMQVWMHIIHRHTAGNTFESLRMQTSQESMLQIANAKWKSVKYCMVVISVAYCIGFFVLVGQFLSLSQLCALQADVTSCIPVTGADMTRIPLQCIETKEATSVINYYEGGWAAVVVAFFSLYAVLFNGIVYAVLIQQPHMSALQRMVLGSKVLWWLLKPFIQKTWKPDDERISDELKIWRQALRRLGLTLAVTSISSFVLKALLELLDMLGTFQGRDSLKFALSTLCAEGVPSVLSLMFLLQYHLAAAKDSLLVPMFETSSDCSVGVAEHNVDASLGES